MKKLTLLAAFMLPASAATTIEGEYLCNDCHGYLTIKATTPSDYQVELVVGGGSCGGEVFVQGDHVQLRKGKLFLTWKDKTKACITEVSVGGGRASVSDSCVRPEDEESSTCAVLGDYTMRSTKK